MIIREPVVAGQFYPAETKPCRAELQRLLDEPATVPTSELPLVGGLVPHAGWMCSGAVAAKVFKALAASGTPDVLVLFGGVHRYRGQPAALFGSGRWETPIGSVEVESRLAERILGYTNLIVEDIHAHEDEHSLEVQMPFISQLFPQTKVVPILVPIRSTATEIGEAVGRTLVAYNYNAMIVGTTDLTHYGPRYGFTPEGVGAEAIAWAKNENDRRFVDLVLAMKAGELVPEASTHRNACNSGAAAATITAVTALGATTGVLLEHTTSSEVLGGKNSAEHHDSVGYAGIAFH